MSDDSRFFSASGAALNTIRLALDGAKVVRIATAYFEPSGYQLLQQVLQNAEVRLLIGRGENQKEQIRAVLDEFIAGLSAFDFQNRSRALAAMREKLSRGQLLVSVGKSGESEQTALDVRYLYHHAKVYIADEDRAVVGSANLSRNGMLHSIEAGITITARDDVNFFIEKFDYYYEKAESITEELLRILDAWLQHYPPFMVYARSLLEIYGLPENDVPGSLPELAGYQKPVVSRALQAIQQHSGAMLVASTGLGKTIMAAHILAYLRMYNNVHSVLVFTPAGLKEMWRRTCRMARTSSAEFSYHTLSADDWNKNRQVNVLEYELSRADPETLIIIDESHHLRNEDATGGLLKLRNRRLLDAIRRGARVLLLTATPYSRHINDLNSQLRLLPRNSENSNPSRDELFESAHWQVNRAAEMPELPVCVVLTAPTVVRHFSQRDQNNSRYVLFSGDQKRYFPENIHLHSIQYENELDTTLFELFQSTLLFRERSADENQGVLFDQNHGIRDPLLEARMLHQFCSSASQIEDLFEKLSFAGGFDKLRFFQQSALTEFVSQKRILLDRLLNHQVENKIEKLLEIIGLHDKEKIVIFCVYRQTARYLTGYLNEQFSEKRVIGSVDLDSDRLEEALKSFAPIANEALFETNSEDKEAQILVATGALAEGFNLQDAAVLVNFDLPWTVLTLAQRMGRILRPWHIPRDIHIYNLIPSTMTDSRLSLALNWKERLLQRNTEHSSLADIPVMVAKDQDHSGVELSSLARMLGDLGNQDLQLDDVIQFIENAEDYQSSSFLDDIAQMESDEVRKLMRLPPGFRSSMHFNKKWLYLLIEFRRTAYPVIFDENARIQIDSEKADSILSIIRCLPDTAGLNAAETQEPDRLDAWQTRCLEVWANNRNISPTDVRIVCSMQLGV